MEQQSSVAERSHGPDVMVSYSSHDRAQVMQFVQRLRAAGVAAWIDQGGIDGAQKWGEEIVNAIDACKTVILMISPTSMQSENIAKEVMLAWENGKHFLPLCLEDAKIPKSMQYQLAGIQHIKLYEGDPEAKFVAVLRALVRLGVRVSPYYIALISADLGEREQALEWLHRACEQRSSGFSRLKTEARFNMLRGDPRFAELLRQSESLPLEDAAISAEIPIMRPQPVVVGGASAKPLALWRRLAWPEIVGDRSARKAAAQGVWAGGFVVVATVLAWLLTSGSGHTSTTGMDWNSPVVVLLIFGPIGFGVQKMGRPAAVIGLALCSLAALGNLGKQQVSSNLVNTYSQYRQYPQYERALAQAESQYYYDWLSLGISVLCAVAFTNATRGTFAYHRMVQSHIAQDKQDAIGGADWAESKAAVSRLLKSKAVADKPSPPPAAVSRPRPLAIRTPEFPAPASVQMQAAIPQPEAVPAPALAMQDSAVAVAPVRQSFAGMIGVSGGVIYWPRVFAFLAANVAAGMAFALSRSLTSSLSVPLVYWLFEIGAACVLTFSAVAALHFIKKIWGVVSAAAGVATVLSLIFYSMLPSFAWADLLYREQFQQFLLLPFVNYFILLAALIWVVPRLQPIFLALWLAAMGTEILTSVVANLLHGLGAGESPDAVLGGASVISALLRSLVFAAVLWGGLEFLRKQSASAAS